jgi:hypothetical protein
MWHVRGKKRNTYRFWWGNPEGRTQFGRPGHRWEHSIKIYLG